MAPTVAADEAVMEIREASPAHFLIKIDSFSLLDSHGIDKYETRVFESGQYKWRLIIYPNGHGRGKDGEGYVSVYLALTDTSGLPANWEVNAVFSICLFNNISGNYLYALGRTRRFHAMKTEWGFEKFISKKEHMDPLNGYLIDDKCVFGAEVFVNENKAVVECLSLMSVDTVVYKREFEIKSFSTLKDVWNSDVFSAGGHKWKIKVYPNGNGGRSLSIFLNHVASNNSLASCEKVKALYTICLKDKSSKEHHVRKPGCNWFSASLAGCNWFSASDNGWGWLSFIDLASLNDPNRGFIVKDCCLLEIELSVQATST